MDPFTRVLIRMAQWLRHPPSRRTVQIIIVVLVVATALVLVERFIGWPDWATTERVPMRRM
ncbi:hypothetical protein HB662_05440 [Roseomonas frigidaquae]|uniref:Uncharacterized protein n=1 Tax=Falsiroseomonas frigidaquae TaxID=487318 RepID=A0ABX1EWD2_9PROT|nr:hypothetical protein [Falsiroseomonas frigidaquae]NKE44210.1 hypothetical protein [Falsiroseomonas frigidaquae]